MTPFVFAMLFISSFNVLSCYFYDFETQFGGCSHFSNLDKFFDTDLLMSINKQTLMSCLEGSASMTGSTKQHEQKSLFQKQTRAEHLVFCACLFFLSLSDHLIALVVLLHVIISNNILYSISADAELLSE